MQYLSVIAGLLATSSAVAIPRQTTPVWSITNFFVSGTPFSIETIYTFDITDGTLATTCSGSSSTDPEIGFLPITNCADPTYSFFFNSEPNGAGLDGFYLEVFENTCGSTCVYVAEQFFPACDVVTITDPSGSGDPNGDFEVLETAINFTLIADGTHI